MTLRTMPPLKHITNRSDLAFETSPKVMQRWNGQIRAASDTDNTISILDPIGADFFGEGVTAKRIAAALRAIGNQDIIINMNSPGGNYFEGVAIYNLLQQHPNKIIVRILGLSASAASIIAMAGDRIEIAKTGQVFIHNTQGVVVGDRNDMREFAEVLTEFDASITELYATRTGSDVKSIAKMMDKETMLTGQAAIDKGFADVFLPSDAIDNARVTNEGDSFDAVMQRIGAIMMEAGVSRSERRNLMNELKSGTPRAAEDAMSRAGVDADLQAFLSRNELTIS